MDNTTLFEALMGDSNGPSNLLPCASRLHDAAPMFLFREVISWSAKQRTHGIAFTSKSRSSSAVCRMVQSVVRNQVPPEGAVNYGPGIWSGGLWVIEDWHCSRFIINHLISNKIFTRDTKYDSKARHLEGVKLTSEVRCYNPRHTTI